ncbi:MAG TPA: prepilin-type N-terminal cleavage/methylation domain-containing protein [Verrucomicrobiae bacterium]|nr:prepilin-type N-terminal cleavage/methylation domain-containing protein [Verrucomicrobiae bacterium]
MKKSQAHQDRSRGFTLVEMAVSAAILTIVIAGTLSLFVSFLRSYNATTLMRNTSSRASMALERMVYGVGSNCGLRAWSAGSILTNYSAGGWKISSNATSLLYFQYSTNTMSIVDQSGKTLCSNVVYSTMTNYGAGCRIWVAVSETAGGRTYTVTNTTFAQFRN